jgi:hypothetical protein
LAGVSLDGRPQQDHVEVRRDVQGNGAGRASERPEENGAQHVSPDARGVPAECKREHTPAT